MNQKSKKIILLIDYENIQNFNLFSIQKKDIYIKIFVDQNQTKIPIALVQSTQAIGQRVEWVSIEGAGKNALDFHIAFYLGKLSKDVGEEAFLIFSKDKGFDHLIEYANKNNVNCQRIEDLKEIETLSL